VARAGTAAGISRGGAEDYDPPAPVAASETTASDELVFIRSEARYNTTARPFDWRFNRNDLNRLLTRIAA
jgi:hypothetical protein